MDFPSLGAKLEKVALYRAYFTFSLSLTCRLESSLVRTESGISLDMFTRTDVGFGLGEGAGSWKFLLTDVRATQACSNLHPGNGTPALSSLLTLGEAEHGSKEAHGLGVCTGEIRGDSLAEPKCSMLVALLKY